VKIRCAWAGSDPLYKAYHDQEWGRPVHDDRRLFEFLLLEGAQAGLSWITVLRRRDAYRQAFADFDPATVAAYGPAKVEELLNNPGIIRNRLKIRAAIANASEFLKVQEEFGSFDRYIWGLVENKQIRNSWKSMQEIPARTDLSDVMSKELKKRGFSFVGSTICYAFMQAVGMVNDHTTDCFCYREVL